MISVDDWRGYLWRKIEDASNKIVDREQRQRRGGSVISEGESVATKKIQPRVHLYLGKDGLTLCGRRAGRSIGSKVKLVRSTPRVKEATCKTCLKVWKP